MKIKEADIAKSVVGWLQKNRWEIYQEVGVGSCNDGHRADIVAVMDPVIWAIEVKTSFSLKVLEQALYWKAFAHQVSIAVPKKRGQWRSYTSGRRDFEARLCKHFGVGLIEIDVVRNFEIKESMEPRFQRKIIQKLKDNLREEHKTWSEAGNDQNDYFTPFKLTVHDLTQFVQQHPGCGLKEALDHIHHHYRTSSTARTCLSKYIRDGIIDSIVMVQSGRYKKLYLKDQEPKKAVQLKLF